MVDAADGSPPTDQAPLREAAKIWPSSVSVSGSVVTTEPAGAETTSLPVSNGPL